MKNILILIFLSTAINSFSQTQEYLYKNDFMDKLINEAERHGEENILDLKDGYLFCEQTKENYYWCIAERVFIDYEKDFEIEIKMKPYNNPKKDAEFGLLFGLRNVNMFHSLIVNTDGMARVGTEIYGQYTPYLNWTDKPGVKSTDGWYIFKIIQKDKKMSYYVNGVLLFVKNLKMLGRWFGWYTNSKMGLQLDYFYIKQDRGQINISKESKDFIIERLNSKINTENEETNPILSNDGKKLYFKRTLNKKNNFRLDDGEGALYKCSFDSTSKTGTETKIKNYIFANPWYMASVPNEKGFYAGEQDNMMATEGNGINFLTEKSGLNDKSKAIKFSSGKTTLNIRHVCLSADEKVMIISGYEEYEPYGMDLYISKKLERTWSVPFKIASLNTKGDEITPFISADMKHIYFSSDGHPGYGFSDVFVATRLDDSWLNWSLPENLGPKINNASYNESYMISPDGNEAFFSSAFNDINNLDIFHLKKKVKIKPVIKPILITKRPQPDTLKDETGKPLK